MDWKICLGITYAASYHIERRRSGSTIQCFKLSCLVKQVKSKPISLNWNKVDMCILFVLIFISLLWVKQSFALLLSRRNYRTTHVAQTDNYLSYHQPFIKSIQNGNRFPNEQTNPAIKWNEGFDIWNTNNMLTFSNFYENIYKKSSNPYNCIHPDI